MKLFLVTVGTIFALIVIAHFARMVAEPEVAHEPWFWLLTIIAAGLSAWSWRLLWTSGTAGRLK
jgi:xanthine/uracil permease